MRTGPRIHDRMAVDGLQTRVVPAPPQVVALFVMSCRAEPRGPRGAVRQLLEDDEALLPVGLVVVGAVERRTPVVHRVEEQVVQHDPTTGSDDPAVVRHLRSSLADRAIAPVCRSGRAAGHAAPQQQRRDQSRVDESRRQPDPCEPAGRGEPGPVRAVSPARELDRRHRLRDEAEELQMAGRRVAYRAEPVERQSPGRRHDGGLAD